MAVGSNVVKTGPTACWKLEPTGLNWGSLGTASRPPIWVSYAADSLLPLNTHVGGGWGELPTLESAEGEENLSLPAGDQSANQVSKADESAMAAGVVGLGGGIEAAEVVGVGRRLAVGPQVAGQEEAEVLAVVGGQVVGEAGGIPPLRHAQNRVATTTAPADRLDGAQLRLGPQVRVGRVVLNCNGDS